MTRKKLIKKIEEHDFYIVNEPSWTKQELKETLKLLKKGVWSK